MTCPQCKGQNVIGASEGRVRCFDCGAKWKPGGREARRGRGKAS